MNGTYKPVKILYVVKTNKGAWWAYRHVEWILKNRNGYQFIVVMPNDTEDMALKYKALGCRVIPYDMSLPVRAPWTFFRKKREIRKMVSELSPDLIHSHFVTTTFMLRLALRKNPVKRIFQVPGPLHLENRFFRFIDKWTMEKNDYLVGSCQWTCDAYRKMGVPENRLFLDYYGMSAHEPMEGHGAFREEYGIGKDTPVVAMVSFFYAPKRYLFQFTGIKGHEDFIDAIKRVKKKFPDVRAAIVGNAWGNAQKYEEHIKALAEKTCPGTFIFTGFRTDVTAIYPEFDVAVHPSHSENLGGAGESLMMAVPTVSTDVGGFPDLVQDGVTGWTVEKKNPEALAEKIIWMLEHREKAKEMALKGREFVLKNLMVPETAQKMCDIYDAILKDGEV